MERAPLRPVPSRPPGPIAPAEALRHVTGKLPGLDEPAAAAIAMVSLVGWTREEIAAATDPSGVAHLSGEALAEALARGRKALRRSLYPLPGSGWCERAERLISDRLDDTLEDPGPARLDVHLANCSRCVEHERRLAQSQDSLVAGFVQAHPAEQPEEQGEPSEPETDVEDSAAAPPLLRAVETPILLPGAGAEALPSPDSPADELPVLERTEEPAQLEEPSEEAEPEVEPPAAVPAAWRRSSATLWSPARPSPPRTLLSADTPRPPALSPPPAPLVAAVPTAAPTVPSTPPPSPPSDPPPSTPSSSWTSEPPRTWTPPAETPGVWRSDAPRPQLAAHRALENDSVWTNVGPLVAVLSAAVVIAMLAALLAAGG